jgi:hypothetical protein
MAQTAKRTSLPNHQTALLASDEALNKAEKALMAPRGKGEEWPALMQSFRQLADSLVPQMATLDKPTRIRLETAVDAWDAATCRGLARLDISRLVAVLNAHWKLRLQPSAEWMQEWYRVSQVRLGGFDGQALATSLYSLSMLRLKPPAEWMRAWLKQTENHWPAYEEQTYSNMLYALAGQKLEGSVIPTAYVLSMARGLENRATEQAGPVMQYHAATTLFDLKQPEWLKQAKKGMQAKFLASSRRSSLEEQFFVLFQSQLGALGSTIVARREKWSPYTLSPIDLALFHEPGKAGGRVANLYVQLDGVGHFVKDDEGAMLLNGKGMIQSALMEKNLGSHEKLLRISGRDFAGDPERVVSGVVDTLLALAEVKPQTEAVADIQHESRRVAAAPAKRRKGN